MTTQTKAVTGLQRLTPAEAKENMREAYTARLRSLSERVEARNATDSRTVAGELKKLAKLLTYKADIYGPSGRIYACDAPFTVQSGKLFHGKMEIDPTTLRDGNGNPIT